MTYLTSPKSYMLNAFKYVHTPQAKDDLFSWDTLCQVSNYYNAIHVVARGVVAQAAGIKHTISLGLYVYIAIPWKVQFLDRC